MLGVFFLAAIAAQFSLVAGDTFSDVRTLGWVSALPALGLTNGSHPDHYLSNNGYVVPFFAAPEGDNNTRPGPTTFTIFTPTDTCRGISKPFGLFYTGSSYVGTININGPVEGTSGLFRELRFVSAATNIWSIDCKTLELTLDPTLVGGSPTICTRVASNLLEYDNTGKECPVGSVATTLVYVVGTPPRAQVIS